MADALRGSMDAVEYKHVVLGQIFVSARAAESREDQVRKERHAPRCRQSGSTAIGKDDWLCDSNLMLRSTFRIEK